MLVHVGVLGVKRMSACLPHREVRDAFAWCGGMAQQLSPILGELCGLGLSLPLEQPQDPDLGGLLQPD